MNASGDAHVDAGSGTPQSYNFTFGHYTQKEPWTDVRALSWEALVALLTAHAIGPKAGTCIVPAVFSGTRRRNEDAVRIEVALLDSDGGETLEAIAEAVRQCGWAAVISSTHSHLTTRTLAKGTEWERFRRKGGESATAEAFLLREKGYLPHVATGARLVTEIGENVLFEHAPCPKFRVAIPLLQPWRAEAYPDWRKAGQVWKGRIEALAAALGLHHDQACTDTSRLFYLPRRPTDGPPPETAVLEGEPCDIVALPEPPGDGPQDQPGGSRRRGRAREAAEFTDASSGEVVDLRAWARECGQRFRLVQALQARHPAVFVGKVADGTKHHIRCPNEAEHTLAGEDAATFICDAGTGGEAKGFVIHCRHAHCDGRDRLFLLRRMLEQGWLGVGDLTDPAFLAGNARAKPVIRFVPGEMPKVVDQAEEALREAELGLYQRGSLIVRPGRVMVTVASGQDVRTQRAIEVGEHALAEAMAQAATWQRYDGRSNDWVPIDAPIKVAKTYRERVGRWRLPVLAGIITAPSLRPDGSLLVEPGYDPVSGLLLDLGAATFPTIPSAPGKDSAVAALGLLSSLVASFPFVEEADRAVALSALLTACVRRSLPTAPLHGFTAPTAGSGKSMLVDIASVIATGREAGVIAQGKAEEELEKRLGALLLAGDQVIAIDNCEAPLGGEFLCSMLTQQVVRPRILGRSEAPELPANAFVTATGNNLVLLGDMTRRALLCRLDPKTERPELRRFTTNPLRVAKAERGRYVAAALTILRAFHVAGRPRLADPLGSFEDWSDWVRGALLWLGMADPVETMKDAREADPRLEELNAVLTYWATAIGDEQVTVRDVIERATAQRTAGGLGAFGPHRPEYAHPDFREALLAVAGQGGAINGRSLGKWLSAVKDRIVDGRSIERGRLRAGILRWRLRGAARAQRDAAAA